MCGATGPTMVRCWRSSLRSLQVTFLAPVPGGPVRARANILRSGKSATHVEARIVDGDNTLAIMVGASIFILNKRVKPE